MNVCGWWLLVRSTTREGEIDCPQLSPHHGLIVHLRPYNCMLYSGASSSDDSWVYMPLLVLFPETAILLKQ